MMTQKPWPRGSLMDKVSVGYYARDVGDDSEPDRRRCNAVTGSMDLISLLQWELLWCPAAPPTEIRWNTRHHTSPSRSFRFVATLCTTSRQPDGQRECLGFIASSLIAACQHAPQCGQGQRIFLCSSLACQVPAPSVWAIIGSVAASLSDESSNSLDERLTTLRTAYLKATANQATKTVEMRKKNDQGIHNLE